MRPIATDPADFQKLRKRGCIYVDKTEFMHRMISDPGTSLFFISRPRRFGNSLTISALKALFAGRRELFQGLAIEKTVWTWETSPIIHFEFNDVGAETLEEFETVFAIHVKERLEEAGYTYDTSWPPPQNFAKAITTLSGASGGKGVVILIDEYDAPVGHALDDVRKAETIRNKISALYSTMKNRTGDIRFMLTTGSSKFTPLSVFSALAGLAAKYPSPLSSSSLPSPLLKYTMIVVAALCIAGCEKEPTREEILRKQREDFIKAKAGLEKMKADAEAQRRDQEEKFSKMIGGAMMKQTMEAASGTAKKNTDADEKARRALDRDFGVPQKKQQEETMPSVIDLTGDDFHAFPQKTEKERQERWMRMKIVSIAGDIR